MHMRIKEKCEACKQEHNTMANVGQENEDAKVMHDYEQVKVIGIHSTIQKPTIQANNFGIKLATI